MPRALHASEERVHIGEGALIGWSTYLFLIIHIYLNVVRYLLSEKQQILLLKNCNNRGSVSHNVNITFR